MSREKSIGLWALTFINVIAINNLRTLPFSAEFGLSAVTYYLILALTFFLPIGFIAAELATAWPKRGGLYIWIKEAYGQNIGFIIAWIQWIYNVLWYPVALTFILSIIDQGLWHHHLSPTQTGLMLALLFWIITWLNCYGMRFSGMISTIGAIIGTLLPMSIIMTLGYQWLHQGHPSATPLHWSALIPDWHHPETLPFLTVILFGLVGLEMSATHADEVENPTRTFPRALVLSACIILSTLMTASLSIAMIIPHNDLNIITGISQAFSMFSASFHLAYLDKFFNILVVIGSLSGVATWVIGPSKTLHIAAKDCGCYPWISQTNRYGAPSHMLILQAVIVSIIGWIYHFVPSIHGIYMLLTAVTAQMALILYIVLFSAAIKLRRSHHHVFRPYRIPGPNAVLYTLAAVGIIACLFGISFSFVVPAVAKGTPHYVLDLLLLNGLMLGLPYILIKQKK